MRNMNAAWSVWGLLVWNALVWRWLPRNAAASRAQLVIAALGRRVATLLTATPTSMVQKALIAQGLGTSHPSIARAWLRSALADGRRVNWQQTSTQTQWAAASALTIAVDVELDDHGFREFPYLTAVLPKFGLSADLTPVAVGRALRTRLAELQEVEEFAETALRKGSRSEAVRAVREYRDSANGSFFVEIADNLLSSLH